LDAEFLVGLEGLVIEGDVVVDGDGVETEIRPHAALSIRGINLAGLDLLDRRRAEGARWGGGIRATGQKVNVGGIVGADGRGDVRGVEDSLLDGQDFAG